MYRSCHSRAGGNPCGVIAAARHGRPRARARRWLLALVLACAAPLTLAGNQKEEALADSVRLALSNAIKDATPPTPSFRNPSDEARYRNWLDTMSYRLKRKLADEQTRTEFLATVWYEARRAGLDPGMVLGLIQVESAYRKYAVSIVGARGYMQVMPFWTNVIGDRNRSALFNMQTNLRYGCSILRMYLDMEAGNVYLALGRYNGSRGKPEYPNAVLAAWNNWK
ncbi:lytic transglycosylase domain-containing protein [Duganella dendranthematis]|uniref:Lytic transglycosylase domain-containing protein n=1 Tax=Duganella dendranthematis TaxID=2728021 RepID=A0ABX6M693_9BURK|nr:lytic transglycosylase domain-containing protein [Duganella dendranthematis]